MLAETSVYENKANSDGTPLGLGWSCLEVVGDRRLKQGHGAGQREEAEQARIGVAMGPCIGEVGSAAEQS